MPRGWYEDTDPESLELLLRLYREMPLAEKLNKVFELNEFNESLQRASVRAMYPNASEREVFLRVASRRLDRDIMIRVYGWDPDLHP